MPVIHRYNDIPCWENSRRIRLLTEFRAHVIEYFTNSEYSWVEEYRHEEPRAIEARQRINLALGTIHRIVATTPISPVIIYTPPPAIGGRVRNIDLIADVMNLDSNDVHHDELIDVIDRAIGVYRDDSRRSVVRTLNPFWWFSRALQWFAHVPFFLLAAAGFDAGRAEKSVIGRSVKALVLLIGGTIAAVASVLTILDLTGWLDLFRDRWPAIFGQGGP